MAKLRPSSIDQALAIARGHVNGYRSTRKFGQNQNVTTAASDIWDGGGVYSWLQTASAVRIRAGGASTDDAASTGAREVMVVGLDENWDQASEVITTAGAAASAPTVTTFIRVFRAYVTGVGSYTGYNDGDLAVETTGGTLVAQIMAERGQTLMAITSVPAKHTLWLTRFRAIVGDTNKTATICMHRRERADIVAAPFGPRRAIVAFDALISGNSENVIFKSYTGIPEKSDLWVSSFTQTGSASVSVDFDYILARNPTP